MQSGKERGADWVFGCLREFGGNKERCQKKVFVRSYVWRVGRICCRLRAFSVTAFGSVTPRGDSFEWKLELGERGRWERAPAMRRPSLQGSVACALSFQILAVCRDPRSSWKLWCIECLLCARHLTCIISNLHNKSSKYKLLLPPWRGNCVSEVKSLAFGHTAAQWRSWGCLERSTTSSYLAVLTTFPSVREQ